MKYDFNAQLDKVSEENNLGGGSDLFYTIAEGNGNVVRVLTPAEVCIYYFQGKGIRPAVAYGYENGDPRKQGTDEFKPTAKFLLYVIDRNDGGVKLAEFPYSIQKAIGEFQKNPDYAFDEVPMPYDIRITYNKSESPANMYRVTASPKHTPVTDDEMSLLAERMEKLTPEQHVRKKKEAQMKADQEAGIWLSPEKVAANNEKFNQDAIAHSKQVSPSVDVSTPEYPEEEINPSDIPF